MIQQRGRNRGPGKNWNGERAELETACGDTAVASSKALHPSDEGEGREGGPGRDASSVTVAGRGGFYMSCFCSVRAM